MLYEKLVLKWDYTKQTWVKVSPRTLYKGDFILIEQDVKWISEVTFHEWSVDVNCISVEKNAQQILDTVNKGKYHDKT